MTDKTLKEIRSQFAAASVNGFEVGVAAAALKMSGAVGDAYNWQLVFDLLHWDWCANNPSLHPDELDRIALKYSPFGEHQEAVIQELIDSAEEWGEALVEAGVSPIQAVVLLGGLGVSSSFQCSST